MTTAIAKRSDQDAGRQPPPGAEERWIRCGGYRTRFLEAGDRTGDPLVLLHEGAYGGSASGSWSALIPGLAARYWVLAPDMLGFGGSDKVVFLDRSPHSFRVEHLTEFLRALNVTKPVNLVGNSFGGAVALRSLTLPERGFEVRSAVSIAGSGGPWRTQTSLNELGVWDGSRGDLARIQRLLIDDFPGFEAQLEDRFQWAVVPGHVKAIKAPGVEVPASARNRIDDPWPRQLHGVRLPTLLVRGTRDVLLEPEWADHVKAALPSASIADIDAKHSPNVDHPEEFSEILLDFIAGCAD